MKDPEQIRQKIELKIERAQEKNRKRQKRIQEKAARRTGGFKRRTDQTAEGVMQSFMGLVEYTREQIEHNLRIQLIVTFGVCFLVAMIVFYSTLQNYARLDDRKYIDYDESASVAEEKMLTLINTLGTSLPNAYNEGFGEIISNKMNDFSETAIYYVVDNNGNILISNNPNAPKAVDFHTLVQKMQEKYKEDLKSGKYSSIVSLKGNQNLWLLIEDQLQGVVKYKKAGNLAGLMAVLQATAVFILMFYIITKQKIQYIQRISTGVGVIARGQLSHRVPETGKDELYRLARSINHMSGSLEDQIVAERVAEKSKQELITNVSHDLRTPLTSILGYLKLVIDHRYDSPEQMDEYLQTVYHKSEQLKVLIDDLFDYTKLTYSGIGLELARISLNELVEQMVEEYIPVLEENTLEMKLDLPPEDTWCMVDPQKLHRVLENLLSNAVKYSDKPGAIYVSIRPVNNGYQLKMENPAKDLEGVDLSKIFDRFYRLETSRSSDTGGSGLGLGIAKGIVEAHGGTIEVGYISGRVAFTIWLPGAV